jgi:hypothetical protein
VYEYVTSGGYTSYDPAAVQLFTQIAQAGNGTEFNAGNGQLPPYNSFILPKLSNPFKLHDLFVHDMSTEWTTTTLDTASDGMASNSFRTSHGAPPSIVATGNPDSDGNGVSDLVEYTLTGHSICNDPSCNAQLATQYQNGICGSFVKSSTGGQVVYTHNQLPQSVFNDCELTLLHASTNNDLIRGTDVPQDIAAVMFFPVSAQGSTSWLTSSAFSDGFTNYQRIKYNIAPLTNAQSVVGLTQYQYALNYLGQNAGPQDCYSATVSNISLSLLDSDTIEVYMIETGVQSSTSKVRIGTKKTDANGNVAFNDADLL